MRPTVTLCLAAGLLASSAGAYAMTTSPTTTDPNLWLEDVEGAKALDWVRAQNADSVKAIAQAPGFAETRDYLRSVLDSDAKIPVVEKIGPFYYNFWKDKAHAAGLWRRTTPAEYRKKDPAWETVLDLDALNAAENKAKDRADYVWHGASCLPPEYRRCLLSLSRGGSDADETREFDLNDKAFVKDGFARPEAKGSLSWRDADTVYVSTDFGPGSMNTSGYARIVKLWRRGTPMSAATTVFESEPKDLGVQAFHDFAPGFERDFVWHAFAFYNNELYLLGKDGKPVRIDLPNSAEKGVHREWLTVQLREPFTDGGKTYPAGSLLATNFDRFMQGERHWEVMFTPTPTTSLASAVWTKDFLLLNLLEDVKSRIEVWYPRPDGWDSSGLDLGEEIVDLAVSAVDPDTSNEYWLTSTSFLTPTSLSLGEAGLRDPEVLKQLPAWFDAGNMEASQHFARSKDGTRVPYFVVSQKGIKLDGSNPTLLYGYGGFEVSMTPGYSAGVGRWVGQGGVYVLANIRGGGEYGPEWHKAALRENRIKAYEDFAAVAEDLIARKVTSTPHLGIQGGSNGGMLMGNMFVLYPQLFGAVVCQVPLLDMKRYSHLLAGASWMAEYGDPDVPADWAFLQKYSPYQNVKKDVDYPPILFTTSTRDDRVHPGHARKMMARMKEQGHDVLYYENIEGGHGGAANNEQAAFMQAMSWTFLKQKLF
jgi:prolyl oligopeptidase